VCSPPRHAQDPPRFGRQLRPKGLPAIVAPQPHKKLTLLFKHLPERAAAARTRGATIAWRPARL